MIYTSYPQWRREREKGRQTRLFWRVRRLTQHMRYRRVTRVNGLAKLRTGRQWRVEGMPCAARRADEKAFVGDVGPTHGDSKAREEVSGPRKSATRLAWSRQPMRPPGTARSISSAQTIARRMHRFVAHAIPARNLRMSRRRIQAVFVREKAFCALSGNNVDRPLTG